MSPSISLDLTVSDDGIVQIRRPEPCPFSFCGSDRIELEPGLGWMRCRCTECHATGPGGRTEAEAIRRWNERAGGGEG